MTSIELPLKKFSKSSIDLLQKAFDPNLTDSREDNIVVNQLYISKYIGEKFKTTLHIIPFTEFNIIYDAKADRIILKVVDAGIFKEFFSTDPIFQTYLKKFRDTTKRFTFYPMTKIKVKAKGKSIDSHSLNAIYDGKLNRVQIFDSITNGFPDYTKVLTDLFASIYRNVSVSYEKEPLVNFSKLEEYNCNKTSYAYESKGLDAVWSLWFLELRLTYPGISFEVLKYKAFKRLENGKKVCEFIRGYAQFVQEIFSNYDIVKTTDKLVIKPRRPSKRILGFTKIESPFLYKFINFFLIRLPVRLAANVIVDVGARVIAPGIFGKK